MGLIPNEHRQPGLRVRHRRSLWTGTITQTTPSGYLIEVAPDGMDGPGRPRFFDGDEFEGVDDATTMFNPTVTLSPEQERARRYLTDPVFYNLVNRLRAGAMDGLWTAQDIQDAALVVEVLERQRMARVASGVEADTRGRSPIQDVRDHLVRFEEWLRGGDTADDIVRGK